MDTRWGRSWPWSSPSNEKLNNSSSRCNTYRKSWAMEEGALTTSSSKQQTSAGKHAAPTTGLKDNAYTRCVCCAPGTQVHCPAKQHLQGSKPSCSARWAASSMLSACGTTPEGSSATSWSSAQPRQRQQHTQGSATAATQHKQLWTSGGRACRMCS